MSPKKPAPPPAKKFGSTKNLGTTGQGLYYTMKVARYQSVLEMTRTELQGLSGAGIIELKEETELLELLWKIRGKCSEVLREKFEEWGVKPC